MIEDIFYLSQELLKVILQEKKLVKDLAKSVFMSVYGDATQWIW